MVFCSLFGFFVILTWLPYYLQSERGIAGGETGFISSLVAWISIPGALLFSSLSDKLGKRKPLILFLVPVAIISMLSIIWMPNMTGVIIALCVYGLVGKLALIRYWWRWWRIVSMKIIIAPRLAYLILSA